MNYLNFSLFVLIVVLIILINKIAKIIVIENEPSKITKQFNSNISNFLDKKIQKFDYLNEDGQTLSFNPKNRLIIFNTTRKCNMNQCFNFQKCSNNFKIFIHKELPVVKISKVYQEILQVFRNSSYATNDPHEACLFILSIDTLDRDKLSKKNYIPNFREIINSLKHWNNGEN